MIVHNLIAKNIKKIKEINIAPPEHLVLICGKNGQGKTSLMDSITYALGGQKLIDSKPIRDGETEAMVELDLGDYIVKRTFTESGTYLTVKTKEGATFPNGQNKLDSLIKNLYFDPMKFNEMKSQEQKQMLLDLIGVDVSEEELKFKSVYEDRTFIGRQLETAKGELNSITKPEEKYFSMKEVSVIDISNDLQKLNAVIYQKEKLVNQISSSKSEINRLERLLEEEKSKLKSANDLLKATNKTYPNLEKDFNEGKELLSNSELTNSKVREAKRYSEAKYKVDDFTSKYDGKTKELKSITETKENKLKIAKMPVTGLGINENGVVFNGIPFDQLSTSEKIKISLGIAMAANSDLKLIRIMDGSLLDSDNMKIIEQMAVDNGYQIFVERVDENSEIGFVIEDGELKK